MLPRGQEEGGAECPSSRHSRAPAQGSMSPVNQHLIKGHADIWKSEAALRCGLPLPCSLNHSLTFCQARMRLSPSLFKNKLKRRREATTAPMGEDDVRAEGKRCCLRQPLCADGREGEQGPCSLLAPFGLARLSGKGLACPHGLALLARCLHPQPRCWRVLAMLGILLAWNMPGGKAGSQPGEAGGRNPAGIPCRKARPAAPARCSYWAQPCPVDLAPPSPCPSHPVHPQPASHPLYSLKCR